ncbi:MAG: hypothetical protein A2896_02910 [Candidatus Nealsonbacteria bacterium RIFCSPLOWO2_01_FULL_43_32]|uniref:HAD family hydrolase n=1 Tax=Candidatus Nealsonbacteria bacterium RIFCSPLOWO2_01_FULL_43_32 TaxID=1801672 RepID=A0A1G2EDI8_9BACT|nr:MAG: hypothetical protein A2896_02910 [Candidatus Nealsonbacteria bacterium RIFCSPLOWO2_01_FULL_43_32]
MKRMVCDFDETLVSTGPIHRQSFETITRRKISDALAKNLRGKSDTEILRILIPLGADLENLLEERQKLLTEIAILVDVEKLKKPGLDEFVTWLRAEELKCAIASSSPNEFVKTIIKNLGIEDVFPVAIGASVITKEEEKRKLPKGSLAKPNPFSVDLAAEKMSQDGKIIYLGDNEIDCLTCCQGNFLGIIVTGNKELAEKYPTMVFRNNLKEVIDVIKGV